MLINPNLKSGEYVSLGDLIATIQTCTQASVCLDLGRFTSKPRDIAPELQEFLAGAGSKNVELLGWIDVHYPCEGPFPVLIRLNVPPVYHEHMKILKLVKAVFELLDIPRESQFQADCFYVEEPLCIINADDEFGTPNQFYSMGP